MFVLKTKIVCNLVMIHIDSYAFAKMAFENYSMKIPNIHVIKITEQYSEICVFFIDIC